jgi:hypothetical protein
VGKRSTWFGVSISMTALDAAVTTYYGPLIWKAFAVVIWSKLLLLLLCAVWATTLLHIWAYACSQLQHTNRECPVAASISVDDVSTQMIGETDV